MWIFYNKYCLCHYAIKHKSKYDTVNESERKSKRRDKRMRERLFRGKCIEGEKKGEWVYGVPFRMPSDDYYIIEDISECSHVLTMWKVDPDTIGQYTELDDSDSERIFEDDIVIIPK